MKFKTRLFVILWLAGFVGALSFLLVDLSALLSLLPVPPGRELPPVTAGLKILTVIQPMIFVSVAVLLGIVLAPKVGLAAPLAEAAAGNDQPLGLALQPQIVPGLIGGLVGGLGIILVWVLFKPLLPPDFVARSAELNNLLPLPTRLLYGGVTEELLLRWGLMTVLVWAAWRLLQRSQGQVRPVYVWGAIIISAIIFGVGHLPIALAIAHNASVALVLYVISANSLFGIIAGYLYWKKGLESSVIAHMMAHVVMLSAIWTMSRWLFA